MKRVAVVLLLLVATAGMGATHNQTETDSDSLSLEEFRMQKRFGIGVSAAGPLSLLGIEVDVNFTENFSVSAGIGTALDYSTLMIKGRYFLLGKSVSPYFGAGLARWWSNGTTDGNLSPSILKETFLPADIDLSKGFSVVLAYPCFGVQFMHPMGLSVFAELQYMFKLMTFASGLYAGLGVHWYL